MPAQLFSKALDVSVDRSRRSPIAVAPDRFQEAVPRQHATLISEHVAQEVEFGGRQLKRFSIDTHIVALFVQRDSVAAKDDVSLALVLDSLQNPANPEKQFTHAERLRNVVVRAELQSQNPIQLLSSGSQQNDRDSLQRRVEFQRLQNFQAAELRKHDVEHHQVRRLLASQLQPLHAVRRRDGFIPGFLQVE